LSAYGWKGLAIGDHAHTGSLASWWLYSRSGSKRFGSRGGSLAVDRLQAGQGRAGSAAGAGVRAFPGLVQVDLGQGGGGGGVPVALGVPVPVALGAAEPGPVVGLVTAVARGVPAGARVAAVVRRPRHSSLARGERP
jgi:hypothetical protein